MHAVRLAALLGLALLVAALGPRGALAQGALPPQGQIAELAQLLDREGTYVASRVRQQVPIAAEEELQSLITRADQQGVTLRIAVLDQTPSGYADLGAFADALLAQMRLRDGLLVVATPQALAARSDGLSSDLVAAAVADGQIALQSQGIVAGITATADAAVGSLAALVTPVPRPAPDEVQVNVPTCAAAPVRVPAPVWPAVVGIGVLLAGLGVYWWTTQRRWNEVLRALEGARAAAERLASAGQASRATVETARLRLAMGDQALETLRTLPWWHVWVWPWAPPPQLALAERAFSESLRLLGGGGARTLAPAGATATGGLAPAEPVLETPPAAGLPLAAIAPLPEPPAAVPYAPNRAAPVAPSDEVTLRGDEPPPAPLPTPPAEPVVGPVAAGPPAAPANVPPSPPPVATTPAPAMGAPHAGVPPALSPPAAPASERASRFFWQRGRSSADADAEPPASLSPEHVLAGLTPQEPVACFFCGLPLQPAQVEVASVALGGLPLQPLTCHRHGELLGAGERPGVRARLIGGYTIPWFQDPSFQPAWDFDPRADGPSVSWDDLPPPDRLFEPQPRVVVHAGDPRWTALRGRGGGG